MQRCSLLYHRPHTLSLHTYQPFIIPKSYKYYFSKVKYTLPTRCRSCSIVSLELSLLCFFFETGSVSLHELDWLRAFCILGWPWTHRSAPLPLEYWDEQFNPELPQSHSVCLLQGCPAVPPLLHPCLCSTVPVALLASLHHVSSALPFS